MSSILEMKIIDMFSHSTDYAQKLKLIPIGSTFNKKFRIHTGIFFKQVSQYIRLVLKLNNGENESMIYVNVDKNVLFYLN